MIVSPDRALMSSQDGRAYLVAQERLAGLLPHPNALGYACAVALVLAWLDSPSRFRKPIASIVLIALIATASRTALFAGLLALTFLIASRLTVRFETIMRIAILGSTAAFSLLPLISSYRESFSSPGRSVLWNYSWAFWPKSPWTGHGTKYWSRLGSSSSGTFQFAFHAHNLWLDLLVTLGLLGALAWAILLIWWMKSVLPDHRGAARRAGGIDVSQAGSAAILICFLVTSATEVPVFHENFDHRMMILYLGLALSGRRYPQSPSLDGTVAHGLKVPSPHRALAGLRPD